MPAIVVTSACACGRRSHLGEAEIEHFHVIARADEDVGGFDVAVDDARGMRGVQRVGDLDAHVEQPCSELSEPAASRSFSVVPSRYSMTMNDRPSCSPMSWIVQMFGWFSADAVCASRANAAQRLGIARRALRRRT